MGHILPPATARAHTIASRMLAEGWAFRSCELDKPVESRCFGVTDWYCSATRCQESRSPSVSELLQCSHDASTDMLWRDCEEDAEALRTRTLIIDAWMMPAERYQRPALLDATVGIWTTTRLFGNKRIKNNGSPLTCDSRKEHSHFKFVNYYPQTVVYA